MSPAERKRRRKAGDKRVGTVSNNQLSQWRTYREEGRWIYPAVFAHDDDLKDSAILAMDEAAQDLYALMARYDKTA